ncbi:MAG: hypothetical protein KDD94_01895 [Calditrichaeota bacterium]|nr:hypothetical protein [Calditrichota bacterium]
MILRFSLLFVLIACASDSTESKGTKLPANAIVIPIATTDTVLTYPVEGTDFYNETDAFVIHSPAVDIRTYVAIPPEKKTYPAVVMNHGSGGQWRNDDAEAGVLSNQYDGWRQLLTDNGMVVIFPDAYGGPVADGGRGTLENEGDWKELPLSLVINSIVVRGKMDVKNAFYFLERLTWPDGSPVVDMERVAVIGISHGGPAALAAVYDTTRTVPFGWEWRISQDGQKYPIDPPYAMPLTGNYKCAVDYYGGGMLNSIFGNPHLAIGEPRSGIYVPSVPVMFHVAEYDDLTDNKEALIQKIIDLGYADRVIRHFYPGEYHSFDGQTSASDLGRQRTLDFLKMHLQIE